MKRKELEHLLRASGDITGEKQFFVIGSQSVLGKFPDAPDALLRSVEADLVAKNQPDLTDKLNVIGELSPFHDSYGYYVDPVSMDTAILPKGWKGRLINVQSLDTNGVVGLCLDPHDLFVSKVAAGRPKDIDFVKVMIEHGMVNKDRVLELAKTVANPEEDLQRSARISQKVEQLYVGIDPNKTRQVDEKSGRYTGKIISMSDTVVQQDVGKGTVKYHDAKKLDRLVILGQTCTIQYQDGAGKVSIKQLDKSRTR